MTTVIIAVVIVLVVLAAVFFVLQRQNHQANIEKADQLRDRAAEEGRSTIAPAQAKAAEADAEAEQARARAEKAEAAAHEARVEAQQVEATHEGQVRAADRLDPRVDHKADDYAPQVAGTEDQQPTPPSEVDTTPEPAAVDEPDVVEPAPASPIPPRNEADAGTETAVQQETATASEPAEPADEPGRAPLLPRRTPGTSDMPGKPMETSDGGGGWFTRKD